LDGFFLKQVELERARWDGRHFDTFQIAAHYARLGEQDEALAWLERAFEARSGEMIWIKLYPYFEKLYPNPRFGDLVRRVGLPQ